MMKGPDSFQSLADESDTGAKHHVGLTPIVIEAFYALRTSEFGLQCGDELPP